MLFIFFVSVCENIRHTKSESKIPALQVSSLTPHAHLFLWPAHTRAGLPPMGPCIVKTEGPDSCGHRLEECLPSGRENVISWDQRIRGQILFLTPRSRFPSMCFSRMQALLLLLTHALLSCTCTDTHMHTLSGGEKWHLFFQLFPLFFFFTYLGLGYKRQPCVFMWQNTQRSVWIRERWMA